MHDVKAYIKHFLAFLLIHFKLTTYGSKSNEAHVLNTIITKMMNKLSKLGRGGWIILKQESVP